MVLTGMPPPALPPKPIFPLELENYQQQMHINSLSPQYNAMVQDYITNIRQGYEKQLECFEELKTSVKGDTFFTSIVVDELDALNEDPFTLDSFENLMRMHASKNKDFILARVTTQDPNDESKLYHSYYGAHQINKVLFRTQPDEGLLHRMKARNPLNNMLVVGDVHYYIISADELNTIKPLPAPQSSNSSVSSHSSRMSRCSKLAAQAILSQSASARSSPILGGDMSLFARSSDLESLESIIPASMTRSILNADLEDSTNLSSTEACETLTQESVSPLRGNANLNSPTSSITQSGFQPTKPSRLRQTVDTIQGFSSATPNTDHPSHTHGYQNQNGHHSPQNHSAQSPLFQSLMNGRIRGRSNTTSSVGSNGSIVSLTFSSTMSAGGDDNQSEYGDQKSRNNGADTDNDSNSELSPTTSSPLSANSHSTHLGDVTYIFRYLASDDDFLLRSAIRQVFKVNALESWDAILFTISNNALREYTGQGRELPPHQHPHQQQQHQEQEQERDDQDEDSEDSSEESDPETPLERNHRPSRHPDISAGNRPTDLSQVQSELSVMNRDIPTASSTALSLQPQMQISSLSSLSLVSSTSSSGSSIAHHDTMGTGAGMLTKHDSGHSSTSSLPSTQSTGAGVGPGTLPRRLVSSSGFPSSSSSSSNGDDCVSERKNSGGKKLRRALSKIFSISQDKH
ncbi:hypothetical protein BGZ76_009927 [Entomortierella beljakovae]|nr:hypothetical protein BGZ76_009927 [Entomortierella beljakovae]